MYTGPGFVDAKSADRLDETATRLFHADYPVLYLVFGLADGMKQNGMNVDVHVLECRQISLITTVTGGAWYTRIYTPPIVLHILKDISFKAVSGQVHGIVGAIGSGKTKLLEALSWGGGGDVGGTATLDKQMLTSRRFAQVCSAVDFRANYPASLTVRQSLHFVARLHLSAKLSTLQIENRINELMVEFDVAGYADQKLEFLTESARRRVYVTLALVKDPILILVDDAASQIAPLSCYQLIYALQSYAARRNRVVVVTMRSPRSDIYQLLSTITILFYGQVAYTGPTKKMPAHFQAVGFPCPLQENPAAYYLSLLSIDSETAERFAETHEQASQLVQFYKERTREEPESSAPTNHSLYGIDQYSALCYAERPHFVVLLGILLRRTFALFLASPLECIGCIFALPVVAIFVVIFSPSLLTGSTTVAYSAMGFWQVSIHLLIIIQNLIYLPLYVQVRNLAYLEKTLYSQVLSFVAFSLFFVIVNSPCLMAAVGIIVWSTGVTTPMVWLELSLIAWLLSAIFCCTLQALANVLKSTASVVVVQTSLLAVVLMLGDGWQRPFSTLANDWLAFGSYLNPLRFSNYLFTVDFISRLPSGGCIRDESSLIDSTSPDQFCRWTNSTSFLKELYATNYAPGDSLTNFVILFSLSVLSFVISVVVHFTSKSMTLQKRMRLKSYQELS